MRIRRADNPELTRVCARLGFKSEARQVGISDITSARLTLASVGGPIRENFNICPFVVGR